MKKKYGSILGVIIFSVLLSACGTSIKENVMTNDNNVNDKNVNENNEATVTVTGELSEKDKDSFAAGIKTEEDSSEVLPDGEEKTEASPTEKEDPVTPEVTETPENNDNESDIVINDEIEERCPITVSTTRKDVKYGEYSHGTYYSETCGVERGYNILLPGDYSTDKRYPVLYLLHGIFGNEFSFSQDSSNKIKEIVGNMAADGYIEDTIIVCPDMYATSDPAQKPAFDADSCLPYDNFINDLVNDLMPYIENNYQVLKGRENTYLAGFSMGGRETIFITLKKPELFGYVCAISAAPGIVATTDKFMTHPGQLEENEVKFAEDAGELPVFILCCGTRDSVVGKYPKSYHELLEKNGSAHIWYEITGADHDNNAIKSGLYNLFKRIAYDKSTD